MRISTAQIFARGINGISNANTELQRTQEQIATGRRVLTPSDDPVASTRILELETELNLSQQFQRNIDNVEGRLQLAEGHINSIELALDRVRELVTQALNPVLSVQDRRSLQVEINQRADEILGIINAQDSNGNYLFSGFKSGTEPFVEVGDGFAYQGDEGIRYEQIGNGLTIASNETGKALFSDIPTTNANVVVQRGTNNDSAVSVAQGRVVDQATFDAVYPENYAISFNPLSNVAPPGPNYSITNTDNGQAVVTDQPFVLGDPITFNGIEVTLSGTPNPGDIFVVESTQKQDILTTIQRISEGVVSVDDPVEREAFIGNAIDDIINVQDSLLEGRARIGARLNTLENARSSQQSLDVINNDIVSELRDLDFAEAVSRLSFQNFVLEAAQQSFVRITSLSLFNFLR